MSRFTKYAGIAVLFAIVAALAVSTAVFAQTPTPGTPKAPFAAGGFGGRGLCGQAGLDAAAKALKMTSAELSAQLWGGARLTDLASKAGVDMQTVQTAVQTACTQAVKDAIQQAVTNGQMTQDKANWLMVGLDKGYWGGNQGGPAFGFGFKMGHMGFGGRGFGRFGSPNGQAPNGTTPNTTPAPSRFSF